jgi:type II secretory pathway pseudopilin PulG
VQSRADDGFTIVEALVAVTILAVAIVLSIQPVMTALRGVSDARIITVAENLAQAEIEIIRSLDYDEIGLPGRTPSGSLAPIRDISVEGRVFTIELDVRYAGSVTGLDVIPQGGDGVQGEWDPGVDYKVAVVTVTASGRELDPIVMDTIIAPTRVGQHEGIANARVILDAHEPFAPSQLPLPVLEIHAPPAAPIGSGMAASEQIWPAIPSGIYTVYVQTSNGWIIHPEDVLTGLDQLEVAAGTTAQTTLRVFRPATLEMEIYDVETGDPVDNARVTLTDIDQGTSTAYAEGEYVITNLMPDTYDLSIAAPGYEDWGLTSIDIPAAYPDPLHRVTANLVPLDPSTSTTTIGPGSSSTTTSTAPSDSRVAVEFVVVDSRGSVVAGANVKVSHPTDGPFSGVTDRFGKITFNLVEGGQYTAIGSTVWGHGPDSDPVDVGRTVDALELTRPRGYGLMALNGGSGAEFLFRSDADDPWRVLPANHQGSASFVGPQDDYQVAKRCLGNGEVEGITWVRVRKDRNRSENISGWCPAT